jgi:segregation and condensation protein B
MPTLSIPDDTPAWIKGDLPSDPADTDAQPKHGQEADPAPAPDNKATPNPAGVTGESGGPAATTDSPEIEARAKGANAAQRQLAGEPQTPLGVETFQAPLNGAEKGPVDSEANQPAPASSAQPATVAEPPAAEPLSLEALIESLLFVADGAVPIGRLAEALEVSNRDVDAALATLSYVFKQRGLSLQRFRDKVQLTTSPSAAAQVERFLGLAAATPLSRAALETLAIVAYQQPVTRPQVDSVRGVNSDSVIKNLLSKGLIEESGRAEGPGRPVLYSTTSEFMQHFGLASLSDLPPLSLPSADGAASPQRILNG